MQVRGGSSFGSISGVADTFRLDRDTALGCVSRMLGCPSIWVGDCWSQRSRPTVAVGEGRLRQAPSPRGTGKPPEGVARGPARCPGGVSCPPRLRRREPSSGRLQGAVVRSSHESVAAPVHPSCVARRITRLRHPTSRAKAARRRLVLPGSARRTLLVWVPLTASPGNSLMRRGRCRGGRARS
jgi:hypothetical protein